MKLTHMRDSCDNQSDCVPNTIFFKEITSDERKSFQNLTKKNHRFEVKLIKSQPKRKKESQITSEKKRIFESFEQ